MQPPKNETTDWPVPHKTPEDVLRNMIRFCAREAKSEKGGQQLWSIVGQLTGHGSGYSADLCRWAGVDPYQRCKRTR